jgi:hypothetical protein
MIDPHCHTSSIAVAVDAETTFAIMGEGVRQGEWAFGSWDRREVEPGLFVGTSLFDGKETWVRIRADKARLTIDYEVGRTRDGLRFRNAARVIRGEALDHAPPSSIVTLLTWRLASQSDAAWEQICVTHETEMFLIKGLLERQRS